MTSPTSESEALTGVLAAAPPRFGEAEAARIAREVFGFDGAVERAFQSERDQNFLLAGDAGLRRVLKISNGGEDPGVLDMEVDAALHARRIDPALPVARPLPSAADPTTYVGSAVDERDTMHMVRMYEFLPGRGSIDGMELDHRALWAYGETLARLGRALRGFFHPSADRVLLWSVEHCLLLRPMTEAIDDRRAARARPRDLRSVRERTSRRGGPGSGPRSSTATSPWTTRSSTTLTASRASWTSATCRTRRCFADPVSALDSVLARCARGDDLFRAAAALLDGYGSVTPLEVEERALIGDTLAARLALTVTISAWRVRAVPRERASTSRAGTGSRGASSNSSPSSVPRRRRAGWAPRTRLRPRTR